MSASQLLYERPVTEWPEASDAEVVRALLNYPVPRPFIYFAFNFRPAAVRLYGWLALQDTLMLVEQHRANTQEQP